MPSRRRVLSLCGLVAASPVSGCLATQEQSKSVDVLLHNDDTEEWPMTVAVEDAAGDEVFRTEETIPADDGVNLGEVLIESAFESALGDQFTVRAWLDGEPEGTFDYEITCENDNRFSLLVEHWPYRPDDGSPVDYVATRCSG